MLHKKDHLVPVKPERRMRFPTSANVRSAVKKALSDRSEVAILYDPPHKAHQLNDFVLFMKPEITSLISFDAFMELFSEVIEKMALARIRINQIFLLSASYLTKNYIIEEHYKAIYDAAKNPLSSLSSKAVSTFKENYDKHPEEVNIVGAFQMLKQHPHIDAHQLNKIWQQNDYVKLDSGCYCSKISYDSEVIFLINGFAPKQIAHYTTDDRFVVLFDLTSNLNWAFLRYDFCGTTNPAEAKPGSLRNFIFVNQQKYHAVIDISYNGIHVSAGPLEALKEKMNFLRISDPGNILFGKKLLQHFTHDEVHHLLSNPTLTINDAVTTVFNLTENMNSDEALELLKKYKH